MLANDIEDLYLSGDFDHIFDTQESFDITHVVDHLHFLEVSQLGIFPVFAISSRRDRSVRIADIIHEDGRSIGQLFLAKNSSIEDFYELSLVEFLAYLCDVDRGDFGNIGHIFSKDYLVTGDVSPFDYDQSLRPSSDIWGGFSHYVRPLESRIPFQDITANSKILVPSAHHSEAFARYTYAQTSFERFLRLYHCVELLFDTITVSRIKKLGPDIRSLSAILSSHESKEVDRLIAISNDFISDPELLARRLTNIADYQDISKIIFDDYSKNGNPIAPNANPPRWSSMITSLSAGRYKETDLKADGAIKNHENYHQFIAKLSAYWIYRVRCSIAHNRIGEFILTDADSDFVACFAEPLLLEFCIQIFSSTNLADLQA
ncbi:hypothetical protein [Novacetimonas hansenii]|uniref:hypothetical protein n=1 Tax=Novacetimonas hansenii TaxID=436 RepID=UPI000A557E65|nr:hypothetical protein [Novacetimonas hansenii]